MSKNIFIVTLFTLLYLPSRAQIIRNGSFELPSVSGTPFYIGLVDRNYDWKKDFEYIDDYLVCSKEKHKDIKCVEEWRSDYNFKKENNPCAEYYLHSPDWFSLANYPNPADDAIRINENNVDIAANTGSSYIGMGTGELIQQEIDNSNLLDVNVDYTFQLYFRPVKGFQFYPNRFENPIFGSQIGWTNPSSCNLKVYIRKNDAEYTPQANLINNFDDNVYNNKQLFNQNTILILDEQIDLSSYPQGNWYPLTSTFNVPDNSYKWIIIEVTESIGSSGTLNHSTYVLLDDISIVKTCELPSCDRTTGLISPQIINNPFGGNIALHVSNLDNVDHAVMSIHNQLSQPPIYSTTLSCTNGMPTPTINGVDYFPLSWDGKNNFGANVANSSYFLKLVLHNSCGEQSFVYQINKTSDFIGTIPSYPTCYSGPIETPIECCELQEDLYLDNITFGADPGLLRYVVSGSIFIGFNGPVHFAAGSKVEFQAGIVILNGLFVTSDVGSEVHQFIKPCSPNLMIRSSDILNDSNYDKQKGTDNNYFPDLTNFDAKTEALIKNQWQKESSDEVIITNNYDQIEITFPNEGEKNIVVFSVYGEIVLNEQKFIGNTLQMNLSDLASGLYFVHIMDENNKYTNKFFVK
jgi:hypothetical protein